MSTTATRRRGGGLRRGLVALVVVALLGPVSAHAQSRSSADIQRDLESARQEAASLSGQLSEVRSQIGSTEQQLAEIAVRLEDARARLQAAEGQVALAEVALVEAQRERDVAIAAHEVAERRLEETEVELAFEEERLAEQLVGTFKYGTAGAQRGAMFLEVLRRSTDPNEYAIAMKQMRTVIDVQESTVERVFALREEQAERTAEAATARAHAAQMAADAQGTLNQVEQLRAEAQAVADEIAADERQQAAILASLQGTAAETSQLLQRASAREQELRLQLAAARAREMGVSDRSGFPGWAGGPDISGAVCPVPGARAGRDFTNDWGYPRWPDRWHRGNDIFASKGTAVVAVADGTVVRINPPGGQSALGGITVTYRTSDGSEWYNAHLDGISSGISPGASVSRGQQIGLVGNTGNARATPPHLHLGRLYGGSWVNPWPTVSGWCG